MGRRPIDFRRLREIVSPAAVLTRLHWPRHRDWYAAWRGPCPHPGCSSRQSRVCTANHQVYHCHRCGRTWDAAGLYALIAGMPAYEAALAVAEIAAVEVPYIER